MMIFLQCTQKIKTEKQDEKDIMIGSLKKKQLYLQQLMAIIFYNIEKVTSDQ